MKHVKLDKTDLKILKELQNNGRITNVDLAKVAEISAPPCLRRVRTLEESGYIRGYHADVAADKLGYGITIFVQVSLTNHAESDLNNFAKHMEGLSQVRECYLLTGDCDFILKVVAEDWEAFQKFLTNMLGGVSNIQHVKSAPVMKRMKFLPGVPIEENK